MPGCNKPMPSIALRDGSFFRLPSFAVLVRIFSLLLLMHCVCADTQWQKIAYQKDALKPVALSPATQAVAVN